MAEVVSATTIPGVIARPLLVHGDERGCFVETFRQEWFPGAPPMLQGNRSDSVAGVLRGLHFHRRQADYWYVPRGVILVALADLRLGSPTEGAVSVFRIGDGHPLGVYIPPGVAHGYLSLTDCTMTYLVDRTYDPTDELGVTWDDPDLAIDWPLGAAHGLPERPILSGRDQKNPKVSELDPAQLVRYVPQGS